MIKYLLFIWFILLTPLAHAGWFWSDDGQLNDYKQRLANTESQLNDQRKSTASWEIAAGFLAVGCIALFTVGTAIGARTRADYTLPIAPSVPHGKQP